MVDTNGAQSALENNGKWSSHSGHRPELFERIGILGVDSELTASKVQEAGANGYLHGTRLQINGILGSASPRGEKGSN